MSPTAAHQNSKTVHTSTINPTTLIDCSRYPINQNTTQYHNLLAHTQAQLAADGCAVLPGFVRADAIDVLIEECDRASQYAHKNYNETNVYFTQDHPNQPPNHPLRRFYPRSNAFVPADNFGPNSLLRTIYEWQPFIHFIQSALQEKSFYRYADPLADVIVNMAEAGPGFPWHFDTNNYTVTLAIQMAEYGGMFEYCPNIRTPTQENYHVVESILNGDRTLIKTAPLEPGDLQIFRGRHALHRVTELGGKRNRYVGIFSFAESPAMVGSVERTKQLYGRVLPIHLEKGQVRGDELVD